MVVKKKKEQEVARFFVFFFFVFFFFCFSDSKKQEVPSVHFTNNGPSPRETSPSPLANSFQPQRFDPFSFFPFFLSFCELLNSYFSPYRWLCLPSIYLRNRKRPQSKVSLSSFLFLNQLFLTLLPSFFFS